MAASDSLFTLCHDDPNGAVELVERMKESPKELSTLIDFRDRFHETPLHIASENGHNQVVKTLLTVNADKDATNDYGCTPLHIASRKGFHRVAKALLAAGADKDAAMTDKRTPLYVASSEGHHQVVKVLLAAGVDKNAANKYDETPLYVASQNGYHPVVELLLEAGADKDAAPKNTGTPLYVASTKGHQKVVEMLLAAGADKDAATKDAKTPLYGASKNNHHQVVEVLLAGSADQESSDKDGWTPLHIASATGHHLVVEILLAANANKDATNSSGETPLFISSQNGYHQVVRHLLSVDADRSKKSNGNSPLDIARNEGHFEVVSLLSSSTRPLPSPLIAASLTRLNRVKLMVMGRAAVGKTTLVRALFGKQLDASIPSTDGIDLGQFHAGGIEFMTWDFGGQKVYRYTHQLFLSSHAVYLVLFKVSDPVSESLKEVRFWLNSILARISNSVVMLVGTHADKVDSKVGESQAKELLHAISQEYPSLFQVGQLVHVISAFASFQPIFKSLLDAIILAGQSVNYPAPKNFATVLHFLAQSQLSPPVIELRTSIVSLQAIPSVGKSENQILNLLKAFHTLGLISVFQNEELPSRGLIVLRPQWIARLLSTIVTTRHSFVNKDNGLLSHSALVNQLWTDHNDFPPERHQDLIDLLVQLDIFFPVDQGRGYFVPCMLREEMPDIGFYLPVQLRDAALQLHRVMELESAVPISVIPPIMVELMGCGELRARWQQGCVVRFPATRPGMHDQVWLQLWRSGGRTIELKMWGESIQTASQWLQRVCSRIDIRLKEFYHIKYHVLIPCRDCLSTDCASGGQFTLVDLRDHVLHSHSEASCQPNGLHSFRLDMLVPDLLFLDLNSRGFIVPFESLTEICELGQGTFGKVLKMSMISPLEAECGVSNQKATTSTGPTCSSRPKPRNPFVTAIASTSAVEKTVVAVKFLGEVKGKENQSSGNFFEEFKHEVYLMSSLDDPNVVKLSGICLQPKLAMVMEVIEGGDLYGQLNDPFRLRSQVYGLVKSLNAAFSDFNLKKTQVHSFRNVFLNRDKLTPDGRERLEMRIVGLLSEPHDDAIGWIQEQIYQDSCNPEVSRLTNTNPTDLGLTAKDLVILGIPKLPMLEKLGDGALERARQAFQKWKESAGSRLVEVIESREQQFFEAVEVLYGMQVAHSSYKDFKRMNERMEKLEDGIEQLSREQALVMAPVDEALRLKLAIDIARGMVHLHELNPPIVHRDLKTPNVFLTRSLINFPSLDNNDDIWMKPLAKVGDFGLSLLSLQSYSFQIRDRAEDDPLLNLNATWAAPELLNSRKYSTHVDVYAMGIIMWELLLRQHPFEDVHKDLVRGEVISGRRPAVPAVMTEDPNLQEYIELMTRCWHQNPAQRPSMREVYNSLRNICQLRCAKLFTKLLPSPPPRVTVSRREHDHHEQEATPIVTSHSFAATDEVLRVSCMLAPLKQQEVLWLGLESGRVALVDYRHGDPQREMLCWIECCEWDKHVQRVTAISHLCKNSDEEGTVWTGSEDGSIHVWSPQLQSLDEVHELNTLKGRLEFLSQGYIYNAYLPCWVECEHGILSWFTQRHDLTPIQTLSLRSVRSVSLIESVTIFLVASDGTNYEFRQPEDNPGGWGAADWHRVLSIIVDTSASSSSGITRLAGQKQSQQAILALEGMDHTMWSANAAFLLTEWGLDNTANHHGLHHTTQLRPLRNVHLDGNRLPARMRLVGGIVRVAASVLWVAVGDRWVVLDVSADKVGMEVTWQEAMVEGMDRIITVFPVRSEEGQGQEVWTIDFGGRRMVWRSDAANPEVAGELVDEGWREEEDGRGYCMVQVGSRQMWMGTSQGRVLSWDAPARHLVQSELQPLPASHPLSHSRLVSAIVSIPGEHPPIVWSVSRDQTLRRFSW